MLFWQLGKGNRNVTKKTGGQILEREYGVAVLAVHFGTIDTKVGTS